MLTKLTAKTVAIGAAALLLAVGAIVYQSLGCTSIGDLTPEMGSQGYRVWSGESLKSFTHRGQDVCVPEGWRAVGAVALGEGTATFERSKTGVLIKQDAFGLRVLEPKSSSYRVSVLYPLTMPRAEVEKLFSVVTNAFTEVGALYGDTPKTTRTEHTVLVTATLAGSEQVYPDPGARATMFVASPKSERGEALLIHAVVHLHNRFGATLEHQTKQEPFNADEFQELEATWAETALTTHPDAAFERLLYLYRVHSAVVTQNISLITGPPFNDPQAFSAIKPTILVQPGGSYLDFQYGHYVLAPLTMAAIDALLVENETGLTVRSILTDIHTGARESFMGTLEEVLSDKDMKTISSWIIADAQIPVSLIQKAIALYDR